ncbi:MAG TPA: asparagine synthetase B, partial [Stellaceae bacterium]|nr:asparagine synthetase B [Stellaceae bacterium]
MGGIAGLMTRDGMPPAAAPLLAMAEALGHRGRDGEGHYRAGDLGMVERRLAIVDLATGDQPLYEPGGAALVADGEIYNHVELRGELPGIAFSTGSD